MRRYLFIPILFFTINAWSAPTTLMSITPSATDGSVIESSDENTRNSNISTPYNAHDHTDITQVGNTLSLGDGTAGNKTIEANNADGTKPFIRFDDTNDRWIISRDGSELTSIVVVTGSTGGKFIMPESPSNNNIMTYSSSSDTWDSGMPISLRDADENTLIQVEESSDENIIRMDTAGIERWTMSAAGERLMPTQPAFNVHNNAAQDNMAASGSVTLVLDVEVLDQGNDFASNTFTAPVTGQYQLNLYVALTNIDTASTSVQLRIETSNRNYFSYMDPQQFAADITGRMSFSINALADMDVNDTAFITYNQTGGSAQVDIQAGGGSDLRFSGFLAL